MEPLILGQAHEKARFPAARHATCHPPCGLDRTGAGSIASEGEVKKLVETAAPVLSEWLTGDEPALPVQRQRGIKCRPAPGLETEPPQFAAARFADDVLQKRRPDPSAQMIRIGAHGLHFAGSIA
jgi:hypothetical protein